MMTPALAQTLAQYNTWQNLQLLDIIGPMDQPALDVERGAFFGSIQRTLSHLLWGDLLWMSRFDTATPKPPTSPDESVTAFATKEDWAAERVSCDARIRTWTNGLLSSDLDGDLTWIYSFEAKQVSKPMGYTVAHFFNHQTHHRGQVHAMLTAAGQKAPVSDLSYMPEDV